MAELPILDWIGSFAREHMLCARPSTSWETSDFVPVIMLRCYMVLVGHYLYRMNTDSLAQLSRAKTPYMNP
jgi:hypothetical protein